MLEFLEYSLLVIILFSIIVGTLQATLQKGR